MEIVALGNIEHSGKQYTKGDIIEKVKKADAERLINMGLAKSIEDDSPSSISDDPETPSEEQGEEPDI